MLRYTRWVLLAAPVALLGLSLWGCGKPGQSENAPLKVTLTGGSLATNGPEKPALTYAVERDSSPGQLTIVDKKGQPQGVCPLAHTDVNADIAGYVSRVSVTQEFQNPTHQPIEAIYTFPLPEDAAVDDMTMQIADRTIKGQILRREEAREVYETAKQEGKAAALLDQERPNIFTQSVANILPGAKVKITISYVNLLKYEEGRYEFAFPMVVGPRYTPGGGYTVPGQRGEPSPSNQGGVKPRNTAVRGDNGTKAIVKDADKITPPITPPGTRAGHDISLTVNLDAGLPIQDVASTLHAVNMTRADQNHATITLQNQNAIPNKDFILRYTVAGEQVQAGVLAYAPDAPAQATTAKGGYFTLILQPPMAPPKETITPKEMVFVIDQTGSQMGWPIKKAKETMRHCLQNLNPGDTFQLIGFNTALFPCFPAPVPDTPENVQKALKFLEPIEGSGGTDILKSVDYALKLKDDPDRLRIICYMTDGYVGNDMQIIHQIQQERGRARMFPFGVGNSVNRFLIEGMAREGRGASDYVTLEEDGKVAAEKFYKRIASPLLLDIQVDWNGMPVEDVFPKHIPDVFTAGPIIVKGRYTHPGEGDITVHGLLRGQPWSQTVHVAFPAAKPESSEIATLWAREKIEDLQSQDWQGAQEGQPNKKITEQIIATALEYRLMSQYTSFVAVEQKVINVGGKTRTLDVPVEMPEGVAYEGILGADADDGLQDGHTRSKSQVLRQRGAYLGGSSGMAYSRKARSAGGSFGSAAGKTPALNTLSEAIKEEKEVAGVMGEVDGSLLLDTETARKQLATMKPADRHTVLQAKLAPALRGLAAKVKKEGKNGSLDKPGLPKVENGRVEVQVRLNSLPTDGLAKLKALGFDLLATLQPNRLMLGAIPVEKLEALIELGFVRKVELPRFQ